MKLAGSEADRNGRRGKRRKCFLLVSKDGVLVSLMCTCVRLMLLIWESDEKKNERRKRERQVREKEFLLLLFLFHLL